MDIEGGRRIRLGAGRCCTISFLFRKANAERESEAKDIGCRCENGKEEIIKENYEGSMSLWVIELS